VFLNFGKERIEYSLCVWNIIKTEEHKISQFCKRNEETIIVAALLLYNSPEFWPMFILFMKYQVRDLKIKLPRKI
jgi:hypothetical protein